MDTLLSIIVCRSEIARLRKKNTQFKKNRAPDRSALIYKQSSNNQVRYETTTSLFRHLLVIRPGHPRRGFFLQGRDPRCKIYMSLSMYNSNRD